MKRFMKYLLFLFLIMFSLNSANAQSYKIRAFKHLTGGVDTSYVDGVNGNNLIVGDLGMVITSTATYFYEVDNSGDAESSPDVIAPDTNPGSFRWKLRETYSRTDHESDFNHANYDTAYGWGDHSSAGYALQSITFTAGEGLTGGGDLSANRTFDLDINGLIADDSPDSAADYVATYDADGGIHKKVLLDTIYGDVDHGGLLGLSDDDHPQYLLADGSRDLTGNMAVDVGITIDSVDISVFKSDYDSHLHDGDTLQLDGINSDGGAFSFTTAGPVTFNQPVAISNATWDLDAYGGDLWIFDVNSFTVTTSDNSYDMFGMLCKPHFNATEMGSLRGGVFLPTTYGGIVDNIIGLHAQVGQGGGTVTNNFIGLNMAMYQAAGTIGGDARVLYLGGLLNGTVTGTSYMLYIEEFNGIDYGIYQNGSAPNILGGTLALNSISAAGVDTDIFLVSNSGEIQSRTGAQVLSDIGGAASGHLHDGDTLQFDGINSDGGAFSFTTTGLVTFAQSINLDTVGTDEFQIGGNRALAMPVDTTNIAIGASAGNSLTTGQYGIFIGTNSATATTDGNYNIAIGYDSLSTNISGEGNTAIGYLALEENLDGIYNTAIGRTSLRYNTSGNYNEAIGFDSQRGNSVSKHTGSYNFSIGYQSMLNSTTASYNMALGYESMYSITLGNHNVGVGYQTLKSVTEGLYNVAIGSGTAISTSTGRYISAIGYNSMRYNTEGWYTIGIGAEAARGNTTAYGNIGIGYQSLYLNQTSGYNIAIGHQAMSSTATASGVYNIALGYISLTSANGGDYNVSVGYRAMVNSTSGDQNIAFGRDAMLQNITGSNNIGIGYNSGYGNQTGTNNISIGQDAGKGVTANNHSNSIAIGYKSLFAHTVGGNNIGIGYQAGDILTTGSGNIVIGYDIDPSGAGANNELNIGNTIYGDLSNGYIGIGKFPTARFELALSTEDLQIVDAGSAAATEQDWIEVTVDGNTGYIRVFAAK